LQFVRRYVAHDSFVHGAFLIRVERTIDAQQQRLVRLAHRPRAEMSDPALPCRLDLVRRPLHAIVGLEFGTASSGDHLRVPSVGVENEHTGRALAEQLPLRPVGRRVGTGNQQPP